MNYRHFYRQIEELAAQHFPRLKNVEVGWDHLISPLEIKLPKSIYQKAERAIQTLFQLSRDPQYQQHIEDRPATIGQPTRHRSVLMAYDFHTTEDGECYLVEINTNAAGFMLAGLMQMAHLEVAPHQHEPLNQLKQSFTEEWRLFSKEGGIPRVVITDDDIDQQKMYPEFLIYQDWFESFGWRTDLVEARDFLYSDHLTSPDQRKVDFVYNRLTDFYLEDESHSALQKAFANEKACLSPNPYEYWLLADKERLIQLSRPEFLTSLNLTEDQKSALQTVLLPTFDRSSFESTEQIWDQRKNLFFKPKRSYGGKSVYRGESVSRKVFERLMAEDILIQRYQPAQKMPVDDPNSILSHWKFDLRFFVYGDQIQIVAARIYQGQVTNFSSPMGGFTFVRF